MAETQAAPSTTAQPVAEFRLTRSVAAQWLLASVVAFFAFAYCFGSVLAALRGGSVEPIVITPAALPAGTVWLTGALAVLGLVVVPHELLHGVFMARFGGTPGYGVGVSHFVLPYAYAETQGASYTRNQMLVVLLAPVTVITVAGLAAMAIFPSALLVVPLAANAAGSIGDLWMAAVLCQYPAEVRVAELPESGIQGFGIYGAAARYPGSHALSTAVIGAVGTLAVSTAVLVGLVFQSLAFGSGTVVVDPNGWLLFRHELRTGGRAALEIGGRLLAGIAVVGGLTWALFTGLWRRLR